jgi:hypothetical protein
LGGGHGLADKRIEGESMPVSLGAVVYHLRMQRNNIKHGNQPRTEEKIVKRITWEIRARMIAKGRFKMSMENLELCNRWNLPRKLLGAA